MNRRQIRNLRELGTVLAALRLWQRCRPDHEEQPPIEQLQDARYAVFDIATDGGLLKPLDNAEIDALCERLNATT